MIVSCCDSVFACRQRPRWPSLKASSVAVPEEADGTAQEPARAERLAGKGWAEKRWPRKKGPWKVALERAPVEGAAMERAAMEGAAMEGVARELAEAASDPHKWKLSMAMMGQKGLWLRQPRQDPGGHGCPKGFQASGGVFG